jgi:hypothetical protein
MTTARIIDRSKIEDTVTLEYPIEFNGTVWDRITVRSPAVRDIAEFSARVAASDKPNFRLPMFDAPDDVLDALHLDDEDKLNEVALRFLPRRFQADTGAKSSASDSGATSPTS